MLPQTDSGDRTFINPVFGLELASHSTGKERGTKSGLDDFGAGYFGGKPLSCADRKVRTTPPSTHKTRGRVGHTQFISSARQGTIHSKRKGCATGPWAFITLTRVVIDLRLIFAYDDPMEKQRENGALLIAACIVAAIRLRGAPVEPSPKLAYVVSESVQLARLVLREVERKN